MRLILLLSTLAGLRVGGWLLYRLREERDGRLLLAAGPVLLAAGSLWLLVQEPLRSDSAVLTGMSTVLVSAAALAAARAWRRQRDDLERELEVSRRQAEEMKRIKASFLATISHEIRTPLTSIIGFASILADEVGEPQREFVHHIDRSGHRLLETLTAMIDLSLIEAGSLELHPQPIDVCREAEAVADRMFDRAAEKGLTLRFQADAPHLWSYLDRLSLERILFRLVDNAVKFTDHGHVTVRVLQRAARIVLEVEDTGIGIGDLFLPHLFEAFRQEDASLTRRHDGMGLGLAVTKRLVDLLGGTIHVETRKGRGSTFTVSFPEARPSSVVTHPSGGSRSAGASYGLSARPSILIVDPSPFTQSYVGLLLGRWCRWTVARDRRAAMSHLRRQRFELVLVNIDYQEFCGLEIMEGVRTALRRSRASVIALTASPSEGEQHLILDAGFDGYIGLPFGGIKE